MIFSVSPPTHGSVLPGRGEEDSGLEENFIFIILILTSSYVSLALAELGLRSCVPPITTTHLNFSYLFISALCSDHQVQNVIIPTLSCKISIETRVTLIKFYPRYCKNTFVRECWTQGVPRLIIDLRNMNLRSACNAHWDFSLYLHSTERERTASLSFTEVCSVYHRVGFILHRFLTQSRASKFITGRQYDYWVLQL